MQSNRYPDRTMDGKLGQEDHCRHQLPGRIAAEVKAVQLIFSLPAPLLPDSPSFFCGQSDFTDEKFGGATHHATDGVLLREQHDRGSDVGQYTANAKAEGEC